MHIPKTSGTAITAGLQAALTPEVEIGGFDHSLFGSFRNFDTLDDSIRRQIHASPASLPKHADLVAGHLAFSTLRAAYPLARYLTILREPVARLLSHWLDPRQDTEAMLAPWGDWAQWVRQARAPLATFLSEPTLACQTDNLMLRALLWPHPLIPEAQFIDPSHADRLVQQAMMHLMEFDFVDVVENRALGHRLQRWLGWPFSHDQHNETSQIPEEFRTPLHRELTPEALDLLDARSQLDLRLWAPIAARHVPGRDVSRLRQQMLLATVARHSVLMAS